jgi:catechol 2,3-dioxygenase-like lactoylglutathione lyase family enzyme
MRVNALDHFNVITDHIDETAEFYTAVLGLERRDGPPPLPANLVQWMFDDAGRALVHINHTECPRAFDRAVFPGEPTGAIHHVAFTCAGFGALIARLKAKDLAHHVNIIESIGLKQVFVTDPNNVVLELNFFAD